MTSHLIWDNVVTYSLQIGLLVGLAGVVPALLRFRLPQAKLAFWHTLLAACLLLPLVRPWRQQIVAATNIQIVTSVAIALPAHAPARSTIPRSELALLLLATGILVRLGWLGVGFRRLRSYRLNSRLLRVHHGCTLLLSNEISSPVTFGWRKPIVLLPASFPEFTERIQDAILCHEMLHVERRDWLFTLTEEVIRAVFWFHPAVWWLLGQIQLSREQAVDRLVIERTDARDEYVDALLAIAGAKPELDMALAPLFLRRRHLKQRVVSIFKEIRMSKTRLFVRLAVGLGILVSACWFVTATFPLAAAPQIVNDAAGVTVDLGATAILHRAPVSYPESARKLGVQGTVVLEATVDRSGNVSDARVMSGPDELRRTALQSVLQWHFGRTAAGSTRAVSITFQLPAAQGTPATETLSQATVQGGRPEVRVKRGGSTEEQRSVAGTMVAEHQEQMKQALQKLQAALVQYRSSSAFVGRALKGVDVLGLSDQITRELLEKLPVHEGDMLDETSHEKIVAAVSEFDEHLLVNLMTAAPGEARLIITAPDFAIRVAAMSAKLIKQPRPSYPPAAKEQRIQGTVRLSAVIAADGTVKHVELISGDPLLSSAAVDAVRQWVYEPTLLNGEPVDVKTEIDVNFTLSQ